MSKSINESVRSETPSTRTVIAVEDHWLLDRFWARTPKKGVRLTTLDGMFMLS